MVKVCPSCSNVSIDELADLFGTQNIEETCLGICGTNSEQSIAYVNGEWIETDSEADFFIEARKLINK